MTKEKAAGIQTHDLLHARTIVLLLSQPGIDLRN